ncbi:MAG: hypothetical protein DRI26_02330 [Chloroflexi bacterium]|nr:MAG: hypothetical protein DRI26_02330 [Chloroflexota bacterium]
MEADRVAFEYGEFLLGDAKELIKDIPDGSVDCILSDPPYGLGYGEYDKDHEFYSLEDELWRVLKPNSWLVFYWSPKSLDKPFRKLHRFGFVWQIIAVFSGTYSKSILGDRKYLPVLVFGKGDPRVRKRGTDLVSCFELPCVVEKIGNSLFKPTAATMQLLEMFSREGDLVLDPFAGFGSIPLVCELFKRRWIAFEINPRWYEIGAEFIRKRQVTEIRLEADEVRQGRLL